MRGLAAVSLIALLVGGCAHPRGPQDAASRHADLVAYEGLYEYEDGATLQIAASPRETLLVAVLEDARYPLRPEGPDTFLTHSRQRVTFVRDRGRVTGYTQAHTGSRVFRRLSAARRLPREAWYARVPARGVEYRYAVPRDLGDGLKVGPLEGTGLDASRLNAMVGQILTAAYPDVHSVLVLKKGVLVFEEYFYEYDVDTPHPLRSATKSFISTLVGLAIDGGLLESVRQPVLPYFERDYGPLANPDDRKGRITIEDLLTNRSGLDCNDWDPRSPGREDALYRTDDWVKTILDLPVRDEPGTVARYCSGGVMTLARLVEKAAGMEVESFARERLFEPLGIRRYHWRFEPNRTSQHTFGQMSLRPRDMAKFGLLFLQGGRWNGRQVVPAAWVETATARHTTLDDTGYGYLWWRPYINVAGGRHEGILATGNGGQKIYLWPSLDMVVVLTGGNYNRQSPSNELLAKYILPPVTSSPDVSAR